MCVVNLRVGTKRAGQPVSARINTLPRNCQQVIEHWQRTAEQIKFLPVSVDVAAPTSELARAKPGERCHEFGSHRHCNLCGSSWRGRATVGDKIDQCHVGFVSDC